MRFLLKSFALAALLATAAASLPAQPGRAPASAAATPLVRGEVVELDAKERRITIRHERIPNLGMDPMTMEFLVPAGEPLPRLAPHDRIRFAASWRDGEYLATRIEIVRHAPAR